jgi:cyclophilin family peptidyl-prolyl cis-trans isomerase
MGHSFTLFPDAGIPTRSSMNWKQQMIIHSTAEQRQVYKTTGGAPHLDGSYTVFGEVISGMEVVDEIAGVETDNEWRPLNDIRLKKVTILK